MGFIFRLPFFFIECMVWFCLGGLITVLQWLVLPGTMILVGLMPRRFGGSVADTLSLGTLRRGFGTLISFLKYGG